MNLIPDFLKFWEEKPEDAEQLLSFSEPNKRDGATEQTVEDDGRSGRYVTHHSFSTQAQNNKQLIEQYRMTSQYHEVDDAIQEIVDDAIVNEAGKETAYLDLEDTNFSEGIKTKVSDTFKEILQLYDFYREGQSIFRHWYVDSRIFFHKVVDKKGNIKELRHIDPRNIEFVRRNKRKIINGVNVITGHEEFFLFDASNSATNISMFSGYRQTDGKIEIPKNAIVYAHSGVTDVDGKTIIGFLNRAIKPANQLRMLEDSMVIYRIARAPERRVFYIDVGNLSGTRANQYVANVMQNMKNRMVYDSSTGTLKTKHNNMTMLEDYYLQRKDGKTATEVSTLPGGQGLGDIEDIEFMNRKLYQSLRVPQSRMPSQSSGVVFDGGTQITRDELKFNKFIERILISFSKVLTDPLGDVLIKNKIVTEEEWKENKKKIKVTFNKDSFFEETKEIEIIERRARTADAMREAIGKYVSHDWVLKNIWRMSDDEIKSEREKITEELKDPIYKPDEEDSGSSGRW